MDGTVGGSIAEPPEIACASFPLPFSASQRQPLAQLLWHRFLAFLCSFPSELHIPKQQSLVLSALAFYVSGIMCILCLTSFAQNYNLFCLWH